MLHERRTGIARVEARDFGRIVVIVDGYVRWAGRDIEAARCIANSINRVDKMERIFSDNQLVKVFR